jgi:two-component system chemotaxis response regulator CheY
METALIIDDSRAIRRILGATMRSLGFEVCEAANGREALDRLRCLSSPVRLMLVDWNMPEMNGLEFVIEVRQDETFESTVIVMVTTETAVDQMVRALEAGANEYIMKPFTKDVIADKLRLLGLVQ